nr:hypothetical protein [Tanacetum cinerariifolium]
MHKKYCLVMTDDFSRFTWVFFLATKDETSRILKRFISEIENLVDKKVKIIRYDNGTEFKNRVMNEFCEEKDQGYFDSGCSRHMIGNISYLTDFKEHDGGGRSPALSFMRPFGCHVTILNTLDQLGKFDGKLDEGIFVGYSTISKAFRVYNTRTRKVEKNLHTTFLENKPMITGTNSNEFEGKGASFDAGQSSLKTGPSQDYILMPLWKDSSLFDSYSQDSNGHNKNKHGLSQESEYDNQERPNADSINTDTPNYADYPSDPLMPDLEDTGIFDDAYDDRDKGAEADYNNLETIILVSPIPSTRMEPKKVTRAFDDESWVEAMQEE